MYIGNRNHFRTHRDQILIGSLVNSKQVNGRALQKDTFTARLLLYVYVGFTPTSIKLAGSASISGMVSGKSGVDMSTPVHPVATPLPPPEGFPGVTECLTSDIFSMLLCGVSDCIIVFSIVLAP